MNALLRSIFISSFVIGISACSILPQTTPTQVLDPQPPVSAAAAAPVHWTLDVARPHTDPVRDSTRVLVRSPDGRLQVHATARWAATAPDLVQTLLVRRLRDRQLFDDARAGSGSGERLLTMDLRRFELDDGSALEAVIVLEARLHDAPRYGLQASRLFEQRQPAASAEPGDLNAAFETALAALFDALAEWLLEQSDPTDPA